jgi:LysM repeat protein/murein endopeptidase
MPPAALVLFVTLAAQAMAADSERAASAGGVRAAVAREAGAEGRGAATPGVGGSIAPSAAAPEVRNVGPVVVSDEGGSIAQKAAAPEVRNVGPVVVSDEGGSIAQKAAAPEVRRLAPVAVLGDSGSIAQSAAVPEVRRLAPVAVLGDGGFAVAPAPTPAGDAGELAADVEAADPEADDSADDAAPDEGEAEAEQLAAVATDGGLLYTTDLSDAELERRWVKDLPALGSVSVGFAEAGRLINGVPMGSGEGWTVVAPEAAFGTQELIDVLTAAAAEVHTQFPTAAPLRVNHLSKKEGGHLRPHVSHQSGRDADLGFFYLEGVQPNAVRGPREKFIDAAQNWALVRALVVHGDVQVLLVDRRVQKALYDYAAAAGEDVAWLDSLFRSGAGSLVQHARRHRDHFHLRLFAGRSQELGRRVQPLLAQRPEENVVIYRIKKGDTLGRIAGRYNSSVKLIQQANRMKSSLLSVGRTLNVPLRGPCTQCPLPPPVRVPPRRLPPAGAGLLAGASSADARPGPTALALAFAKVAVVDEESRGFVAIDGGVAGEPSPAPGALDAGPVMFAGGPTDAGPAAHP